jgi:cold shock CspA family protein
MNNKKKELNMKRMHGTIKWYNELRGFGVIIGKDNKEYFVHCSNLTDGIKAREGMLVLFEPRSRPKKNGLEAIAVGKDDTLPTTPKKILSYHPPVPQVDISPMPQKTIEPPPNQKSPGTDYWYTAYTTNTANTEQKSIESQVNNVYDTKVVGVTYENRQHVVALCSVGDQVLLIREPKNSYDSNAVMVVRENGQQIGYINRLLAGCISWRLDKLNKPIRATIKAITGGYYDHSLLGVDIYFSIPDNPINPIND